MACWAPVLAQRAVSEDPRWTRAVRVVHEASAEICIDSSSLGLHSAMGQSSDGIRFTFHVLSFTSSESGFFSILRDTWRNRSDLGDRSDRGESFPLCSRD